MKDQEVRNSGRLAGREPRPLGPATHLTSMGQSLYQDPGIPGLQVRQEHQWRRGKLLFEDPCLPGAVGRITGDQNEMYLK